MKILLITILSFLSLFAFGQNGIFNFGEEISVVEGTSVYINGDISNNDKQLSTAATDARLFNRGEIYLTGDLINNYTKKLFWSDSLGKVIFNGTGVQNITGDSIRIFYLVVNNTAGVQLGSNIIVNDSLLFQQGSLNLNNNVVYLPDNIGAGLLVGETETSSVYGTGGYIETTRVIGDATGENVAGLGLTIQNLSTIGNTTLRRYHYAQTNAGDGSINKFFTVSTNQPDTIALQFDYFDAELNGLIESELDVWFSQDSVFWRKQNGTNQFATNNVSGSVAPSGTFGIITLAEKNCDFPPVVNLGNSTQYLCGTNSLVLDAQNTGLEYKWNTTETTQSIVVNTAGNYFVEVTDTNGCIGRDTVNVIAQPNPVAQFTTADECFNTAVGFTNSSTIASGSLTYHWDFGDAALTNDTSNLASPSYLYQTEGLYSVKLVATSGFGCVDSILQPVRVHPIPTAAFSFVNACTDSTVQFTNTTSIVSPVDGQAYGIANYAWDFGDGNTSTLTAPSHTYLTAGTYTVQLAVQSNFGCWDTLIQSITIYPNPVATFTNSQACANTLMQFTDGSTNAAVYNWDFGDGNVSAIASPTNNYTTPGTFNVSLVVTSANGCTNSTQTMVNVDTVPVAGFVFTSVCENDLLQFTNTSSNYSGSAVFNWDFNDGNTSILENPSNTFISNGVYSVSLTVTASNTCSDTFIKNVTIFPKPVPGFVVGNACAESIVNFTNTTTVASGTSSYQWDFGDNTSTTVTSPSHSYLVDGNYTVKLIATSNNNCVDSAQQVLTIFPLPIVNLGGNVSTCAGSIVLDAQNTGSTYLWSDNSTAQTLTAAVNGMYWAEVTSTQNCITRDTAYVTLNVPSNPQLGNDTTVCDSLFVSAFSPGGTYSWSGGEVTDNITITTTGTYWVDRIDQNGCPGTDTIVVAVNYSPVVDLGADTTLCDGNVLVLDAANGGNTLLWSTAETTSQISVATGGQYYVDVTTIDGCSASDSIVTMFNPLPTVSLGNDTTVCDQVTYDAGVQSTYLWSTGNTLSTETITTTGTYWVEVANTFNCVNSDTVLVSVFPSPNVALGPDLALCYGSSISLDAGTAASYSWNTGETSQVVVADTSGMYVVTATSGICSSTDSVVIIIDSLWQVNLGGNQYICPNSIVTLDAGITGWTYQWGSINGGMLGQQQTQIVTATDVVWVDVTNPYGCTDTDTVIVNPAPYPVVSEFLVATELRPGDTVHFVPVSTDSITDYYWDFDDGVTSTDANPWHIYYIIDTFYVELIVANEYCSDTLVKPVIVSPAKGGDWFAYDVEEDTLSDIRYLWMYPNPNNGEFTLFSELSGEKDISVDIYSVSGKLVDQKGGRTQLLKQTYSMEAFEPGVYLIVLRAGLEKKVLKWVKI